MVSLHVHFVPAVWKQCKDEILEGDGLFSNLDSVNFFKDALMRVVSIVHWPNFLNQIISLSGYIHINSEVKKPSTLNVDDIMVELQFGECVAAW